MLYVCRMSSRMPYTLMHAWPASRTKRLLRNVYRHLYSLMTDMHTCMLLFHAMHACRDAHIMISNIFTCHMQLQM